MRGIEQLYQVFTSNFYINAQYAQSFVPLGLTLLRGKIQLEEPDKLKLEAAAVSNSVDTGLSEKAVAIISIKQPILKYGTWRYLGSKDYIRILNELEAREDIAGVVLDIDSGGGTSYGTPEFYDAVKNFSKPIGTFTDGYLCSAAYYVGSPADFVMAHPRANFIGSIGGYSQYLDLKGLMDKWGVKLVPMYSNHSPEKNKGYRELAENGDPAPYIKNILDPMIKTFQEDMKAVRPGLNEDVLKGADYSPEKALEMGLIDEIGTLETAVLRVFESAKQAQNKNNNPNKSEMSKEKSFPRLAAVLGLEDVEAKKAHIFSVTETVSLTADQLSAIEAALPGSEDGAQTAELQSQLTAANTALSAANKQVTEMTSAVNAALEATGLTKEKKETTLADIQLLSDKVVEYGGRDGGKLTNAFSKGDKHADEAAFVDEIAQEVGIDNL